MKNKQLTLHLYAKQHKLKFCASRLSLQLIDGLRFAVISGKNPCKVFEWRSDGLYTSSTFSIEFLLWKLDGREPPYPRNQFKKLGITGAVCGMAGINGGSSHD